MLTVTPLRKALATDSAAASFSATILPASSAPSGDGVFDLFDRGIGVGMDNYIPKFLQLIPYGGNDDNDVINLRVYGWSRDIGQGTFWIPQLLVELQATLSATLVATVLGTGLILADTLTATTGATDEKTLGVSLISPTGDVGAASALQHLRGCRYIQFDFKKGAGADKMNCLWRAMDQCD